jgi:curved DNA-binding protein CbpA
MNNRRNFYRILQVQPEAPVAIIKASYRILMTKLNAHPDRGGDHETAVLLNQAYAVLSDVQKRKKYDDMLYSRIHEGRKGSGGFSTFKRSGSSSGDGQNATYNDWKQSRTATDNFRHNCSFCDAEFVPQLHKYCRQCKSPLSLAKRFASRPCDEQYGRRSVPRIAKHGVLVMFPCWPHSGLNVQLVDLSIFGLRVLTGYPAKTGEILKFDSPFFKGIGKVVSVRANDAQFTVHATFLTAEFVTKSGTFVAQRA